MLKAREVELNYSLLLNQFMWHAHSSNVKHINLIFCFFLYFEPNKKSAELRLGHIGVIVIRIVSELAYAHIFVYVARNGTFDCDES